MTNNQLLFDTNMIIDYLRGRGPHLEMLNSEDIGFISFITVGELYAGLKDKKEQREVQKALKKFKIVMANEKICEVATELVEKFTLSHHMLLLDALIAATAIGYNFTVVTQNTKHFSMIPDLKLYKFKS
jgi:predicted nucleic acid-binding protein